nr:extracellular solute-binding protein [Kineosporia babensis]
MKVAAYAGSWGESLTKAFVEPFEENTGATVELVPGDPASWLTGLRSAQGGTPPYDVVAFTPNVIPNAVDAGVVQALDTAKVENFGELNEVLVEQSNIGGQQYGVPLSVGSTGIAYRTDKVKTAPKDWSDLLDPATCGHAGLNPLTFNMGVEYLAGLIRENGGDIQNQADVDAAFAELAAAKDCFSAFPADAPSVESGLQNGDTWISAHWDGRAFVMQNNGDPVDYAYPASGSVGALTSFFVAENTEEQDLAYEFLNYLASSEYQPTFSEGTWYATSNDSNEYPAKFEEQIKHGKGAYDDFQWIDYQALSPKLADLQAQWQKTFGS